MENLKQLDYFTNFQDSLFYHAMQGITLLCLLWLFIRRKYESGRSPLTPEEEEKLIAEWMPEPLVPEIRPDHPAINPRILYGKIGHYMNVDGNKCLDLATHNYFRLVGRDEVNERALRDLRTYGVGSCGPRAFYGTAMAHLDLEEKLAQFLGQQDAIVFSYGFSTISTVIPAHARRGDVIFVDEACHFAIQKGLEASRSAIRYFKHNNVKHLEQLLNEQETIDQKSPNKGATTRRFLVVEGIYINTGSICPLPPMVSLAQRYKTRIILDESVSFGTLGATGRGLPEHFQISRDVIDVTVGSLETCLGSIGGFSVGSTCVIEHQRMHAQGYGYSASLPPLLAGAAHAALDHFVNAPEAESRATLRKLHVACRRLHTGLATLESVGLALDGDSLSVIKHLYAPILLQDHKRHDATLRSIANQCISNGVAVIVAPYLNELENNNPRPSLRVTANVDLTEEEIHFVVKVLRQSAKNCFDGTL